MRVNYNYIKIFVLLVLVVFLYAFTNAKNANRIIDEPNVSFIGSDNLFLTHDNVSKLLILNHEGLKNKNKEIIDLNQLEFALNSNPMIRSAEVYLTVNGALHADIVQKKPIARVSTNASFYIDEEGSYMPLSSNFSARVPIVTGFVRKEALSNVLQIAQKVYNDEFLKKYVIEIHQNEDSSIDLRLRQSSFIVHLGRLNQLDKKVNNLKVFYQKALKEKTLNNYSKINLQFDNQVVCTKT